MDQTLDYIYSQEEKNQDILRLLHNIIMSCSYDIVPKIRFKIPFYDIYNRWMIYISVTKKGKCELSFVFGNELSLSEILLESKGRKQVRSIAFDHITDIQEDSLRQIIYEAIILNEIRFSKKIKSKKKLK